jgi:hypothetical protein
LGQKAWTISIYGHFHTFWKNVLSKKNAFWDKKAWTVAHGFDRFWLIFIPFTLIWGEWKTSILNNFLRFCMVLLEFCPSLHVLYYFGSLIFIFHYFYQFCLIFDLFLVIVTPLKKVMHACVIFNNWWIVNNLFRIKYMFASNSVEYDLQKPMKRKEYSIWLYSIRHSVCCMCCHILHFYVSS